MIDVLIPYRPSSEREPLLNWTVARWRAHGRQLGDQLRVTVADADPARPFNRGGSRNAAWREADPRDVVIVADADTVLPVEQLQAGLVAARHWPWVIPHSVYFNLDEDTTTRLLTTDPVEPLMPPVAWEHRIDDAICGVLIMKADNFLCAGGYDDRFEGWGYEDDAFRVTMDTMVGHHARIRGPVHHLWHPVAQDAGFENPSIEANRKLYNRYRLAARSPQKMAALILEKKQCSSASSGLESSVSLSPSC